MVSKIIREIKLAGKKKVEVFKELPIEKQGFILLKLPKKIQKEILEKLHEKEIIEVLHFLDPDEITDVLQNLKESKRKKILEKLETEIKDKVEFLLKFEPKSAAGLMSLDYIEVSKRETIKGVYKQVEEHIRKTGKTPLILVIDDGKLIGEVPLHKLMISKSAYVKDCIVPIPTVKYDLKQEECIKTFREHSHEKVAVVDEDDSVIGIIYAKDLLSVIEREATEDLYGFAGVKEEEDVLDPTMTKVKYRYKWLIINLATAFLAASVVGLFRGTISKIVLLAVYMPIVAGMGGNAGTQTLAVVVRGLVLKEIDLKHGWKVLRREISAGVINGIINGAIVAAVAVFINQSPMLGLVIGLAMVINLVIAGLFGTIVPLILKALGSDPASSATVFITTATDVFGFLSFLGLATILLL